MKKNLQTAFSTRQYMLSKDFEIYYYKDNNLSKVESHTHDYYEFYFFIEGNVSMCVEGHEYPLRYGDIMLIPPKTRHYALIHDHNSPYRRFVLWISKEYCAQMIKSDPAYSYIFNEAQANDCFHLTNNTPVDFNAVTAKVFHLIEEIHSNRYGKDAQIALDLQSLILHINRNAYNKNHPDKNTDDQPVYEILLEYIENHISDDLSLDTISSYFHLNKYYISHLFKEYHGLSIHQYIIRKRLDLCRESLQTNSNIADVCQMYGFSDYSVFYRAFKKEYGMSPKAYLRTLYT